MSAPFGRYRPGDAGFDWHAPLYGNRPIAVCGTLWAILLITGATVALLLFVRLSHHRPWPPLLRATIHESWVAPMLEKELRLAKLRMPEDQP